MYYDDILWQKSPIKLKLFKWTEKENFYGNMIYVICRGFQWNALWQNILCSEWLWRRFQCFVWENRSSWNINHGVELVPVLAAYFWWRALCWCIILIILSMTSMMILLNNSVTIIFAKGLYFTSRSFVFDFVQL